MDGTSPWVILAGTGGLATFLVGIFTLWSSRHLVRADTGAKVVESAGDQIDRVTKEAQVAIRERDALRRLMRRRDDLADAHDIWDRDTIRRARDAGLTLLPRPSLYPSETEYIPPERPEVE